jgi:excisionase family DNA binding protein
MPETTATTPTRRDAAEASTPALLDTLAAARFLSMGKRTVQELVAARKLAFIKIGRATRFHVADLEAFIDSNRVKAAGWKGGAK